MNNLSGILNAYFPFELKVFWSARRINRMCDKEHDYQINNARSLVDEAVVFIRQMEYPICVYYGTEKYMTHKDKVIGGEPYADVYVRKPMRWDYFL